MIAAEPIDRASGALALAVGIVAIASVVSLVAFFMVGRPFGSLNDAGNAITGVLSGLLALRLARPHGRLPTTAAAWWGVR